MKNIISLFLLFLFHSNLFGQALSGKITDFLSEPIAEANILNITSGRHTHTDEKGSFLLDDVALNDTLIISHLSYKERQIIVRSLTSPLNIVLDIKSISLDEVVISPKVNALNMITYIDIQVNPVNNSQEILRQVPGLFIGQHAGGGKAEQIFLRGFDLDHGTDILITADGLPVNMVSHAHGQGYADLHFVIPETIDNIDFGKGPYFADKGNLNTSAYVNFNTKRSLDNSLIKLELGQFNSSRLVGMFGLVNNEKNQSYIATEYLATDGPFETPQNFNRINLFGKYTGNISNSTKLGVIASYFTSKWDASGQVPQRAVDNGTITRFGAIDDNEGGNTSRANVMINHEKFIDNTSFIKNSFYFSSYDFELYSNFTFFLLDSINGDQIRQKENRFMYGLNSEYNKSFVSSNFKGTWQAGINLRYDQSMNNELSHTLDRKITLDQIALGNIYETNFGTYFNIILDFGRLTINPAIRLDLFDFQYNDALQLEYNTKRTNEAIVCPKLNILYNYSQDLQIYLKGGKGFHSNDARVILAQSEEQILPPAYGFDAGVLWKPLPRLLINMAYWYLFLEQELVYVGDAGIVEPSGQTKRNGFDFSVRYQALNWLFWSFDANYSHARSVEEGPGENYIPLAPNFTLVSGLNVMQSTGVYGGINVRYFADRPANEDNSIVAIGYTIVDLNVGYIWKKFDFGIQIQNLLNTEWNETQFATESRLKDELTSVEEIHFIPGIPFFIKGVIEFKF